MGALADVYSSADVLKRRLKDLASAPGAYIEQLVDHLYNRATAPGGVTEMALNNLSPGSGALGVITNRMMRGLGPAVTARTFEQADLPALQELLSQFGKARALPQDHASIFSQLMEHAGESPVPTTVGLDHMGRPVSVHQTARAGVDSPYPDSDYLAHLLSLNGPKGAGTQALNDAALNSNSGKMTLYPTHDAKDFYEKVMQTQPGWSKEPSEELGIDRFVWRQPPELAKGGLIQACQCNKADGGMVPSHSELYQARDLPGSDQAALGPQEHRAFAREWTRENPLLAVPSLLAAIPTYSIAKKLGAIRGRSPASLNEVLEGYRGVLDGLGLNDSGNQ